MTPWLLLVSAQRCCYGPPRIHKRGIHLRFIVPSRGITTYEAAKELFRILRPLVGRSPHHLKKDFVDQIQLKEGECSSFDVSAIFTSMPTDCALNILRRKLEQDQELNVRTSMTVEHIVSLLEFCLKTTYFQFQGRYFEQIQEAAMGSPIS